MNDLVKPGSGLRIGRRAFLRLAGGVPVLWPLQPAPAFGASPASVSVVLAGVRPETPASLLSAVLAPFWARGLPLACALNLDEGVHVDLPAIRVLRDFAEAAPDLVEIAANAPGLTASQPYFQMRRAGILRQNLLAAFPPSGHPPGQARPLTATCDVADYEFAPGGLRSAGFRVLLQRTEEPERVEARTVDPGVLHLRGGTTLRLPGISSVAPALAALGRAVQPGRRALLWLSLDGDGAPDVSAAGAVAGALAEWLAERVQAGSIVMRRPGDAEAMEGAGKPLLGLVLSAPPAADLAARDAVAQFASALASKGIGYSLAAADPVAWDEFAQGETCSLSEGLLPPPHAPGAQAPGCLVVSADKLLGGADEAPSVYTDLVVRLGDGAGAQGMRDDGRLQIEGVRLAAAHPPPPADGDRVLVIPPEALSTEADRENLLAALLRRSAPAGPGVRAVSALDRALRPEDPIFEAFRLARRRSLVDAPVAPAGAADIPEAERAALLDDARLAWRYFERFTDPTTGFCATTVQENDDPVLFLPATMWDVGSHVQGIVAAAALGIIGHDEASRRAGMIVTGLPSGTVRGMSLPPWIIETRPRVTAEAGFNACDVGRLLVALASLRASGLVPEGLVDDLVGGWDLAGTLKEGRMQNIRYGLASDVFLSQCTHYTARGMALWGVEAASPYAVMGGETETDARLHLLYQVSSIGQFGSEPLLLEGIELGFSRPAAYLAQVLFSAQREDYERTGRLRCVSEAPVNFPPWFIYHGLRLDRPDDPWELRAITDAPDYRTEAFRQKAELVSAKGAYLWAAAYPHPYSQELVDFVRARARVPDLGFSPGVFSYSGEGMKGYSDANTNGIVLSAIAARLGAIVPL